MGKSERRRSASNTSVCLYTFSALASVPLLLFDCEADDNSEHSLVTPPLDRILSLTAQGRWKNGWKSPSVWLLT